MGVVFTKPHSVLLKGQYNKEVDRAAPFYTYKPFPAHRNSNPGELIRRFKAVPYVKDDETDFYWWTDCEFLPNDDSRVVSSSSPYTIQPNQSLLISRKVPCGKICMFDFSPERIRCEVFKQASVGFLPKLHPFPDGDSIVSLGSARGEIKLLSLQKAITMNRAVDFTFRVYKCVAVSPDGRRFAIMARNCKGKYKYEMVIFNSNYSTIPEEIIDCANINNEFHGNKYNLELSCCKWSPDSDFVAASMSHGPLIVVFRKDSTCMCCVFPDVIPDTCLSRENTFDFDPQTFHQVMAVGTQNRYLYIINVETGCVLSKTEDVCGEDTIDVVKYSGDGRFVGVALKNFTIQLYDPDTCCVTYTVQMKDSVPSLSVSPGPYPSVINLSFTSSGEQVVTSTPDGYICLWQLPKKFDLRSMCKLEILSRVGLDSISKLPIPTQIMDYLLSMPSNL